MEKRVMQIYTATVALAAVFGGWSVMMGRLWGIFFLAAAWVIYLVSYKQKTSRGDGDFLTGFMKSLVVVLAVIGMTLYFAAYFYGIFFLIAAVVVYILVQKRLVGLEQVKKELASNGRNLLVPFFGIITAIIIGGIIMALTGYNPFTSYAALFYGGFVKNWHIALLNATPLIFTGLSIAFAFQANLFNIGAEGQYYIGAMVSTYLAMKLQLPTFFSLIVILTVSTALAAAWNYVPALLKVRTGAHEVITTMMLAHTAKFISPIFIKAFGGDPSTSTHPYVTDPILESNWLPLFKTFLPKANYRLHVGILIAIGMALVVQYILYKTKYGFEIRAVGQNKNAARAQGISVSKNIFRALLFSGILAGMAGVIQITGLEHKQSLNLAAGYGWNGISVALLASNNPIGVIFTALLWGALDAGGQYMVRVTDTPNSIVEIIKGIILFLVVAKYIYTHLGNKIEKKRKLRKASHLEAAKEGGKA